MSYDPSPVHLKKPHFGQSGSVRLLSRIFDCQRSRIDLVVSNLRLFDFAEGTFLQLFALGQGLT